MIEHCWKRVAAGRHWSNSMRTSCRYWRVCSACPRAVPVDQLSQLRARFGLDAVVYTRAERGTMLVLPDEVIAPPAVSYPAAPNADAVGAGDACTAGILVGWSLGLPPVRTVELANHLAHSSPRSQAQRRCCRREIISLVERA